jgi:hypothetical protein
MIHKDLATGAEALRHTYAVAPDALPELVVAFNIGIELMRRELLMYLWRNQ